MPGGDRTGPLGAGPMTGRGLGYCAGYGIPGFAHGGGGRGFGGRGMGRGRGGGWRHGFHGMGRGRWWGMVPSGASDPAQERELLQREQSFLKSQMEQIQERLEELGEKS